MVVLQHLRRVRWAVRATLILGVAASVVANVLHALDNPISQAIAAWPPLALLLTVELISRVPVHRRWLAAARLIATATIAGIAAWVSYWHMVGVAARYGETGASPYLLPLSVDGLIVVASICLVELGGRITTLERDDATPAAAVAEPAIPGLIPTPTIAPAAPDPSWATHQAATAGAPATGARSGSPLRRRALEEAAAALPRANGADTTGFNPALTRQARPPVTSGRAVPAQRGSAAVKAAAIPAQRTSATVKADAAAAQRGSATVKAGAGRGGGNGRSGGDGPPRIEKKEKARRSPTETVAIAARLKADRPALTDAEIAAELGITTSRLRAVRREAQAGDHTLAA
ncbi:DUF2637 domain-containing protein [Actinoplanes sp. NPDC026619]|uniref:DUF2637 domain-containing protein n=1 Tax=Actinoplanes sp. NPDC026619 TaxID=3155798 RepID=UPI0033C45EBC